MSAIDLIAAAFIALGAWRGRSRGLPDEGYRLLRIALAFLAGCGLYRFVSELLKQAFSMAGDISAPLAFVGTIGGTWWLMRVVKKTLTRFLAARFARHARLGGAIAGGIRVLLIVLSIAGAFYLADRAPGHDAVSAKSIVGRMAVWVMPRR